MSYTPTTWQTGDIVTAQKLNKIENGIATGSSGDSSAMIVHAVYPEDLSQSTLITLDKTWQEIHDAFVAGTNVMVELTVDANIITDESCESGIIRVRVIMVISGHPFDSGAFTNTFEYLVRLEEGAGYTSLRSTDYTTDSADGYPSFDYNT